MTPNSTRRLLCVAMLLIGSCWPVYGQTSPDVTPSSKADSNLATPKNGDIDQLIVSVIESSKSDPMSEEQLRQAIDTLTQQIAYSPHDVKLMVARAAAHVRLREMDEANKDLAIVLKKAPNDGRAWYVYALMKIDGTSPEFDAEAVKEGLAALKKAYELGYTDPKLYAFLGAAHQRLGDYRRAINALTKAIEGNLKEAYGYRGDMYSLMGEHQLAIADYSKAIQLGIAEPQIFWQRGSAYWEVKNYRGAVSDFTSVIAAMPDSAEAYHARAQCLVATNDWSAAIKDFDRAIHIQPSCAFISERGCAYIKHKEYKKGIADIRKAIQLNPGDLGNTYQASTDKKLSAEALAHGEQQIRQMLKDRPAMATHVAPGDKLWTWAVRKFAGEDLGTLVYWDSTTPVMAAAANVPSDGKSYGRIQVAPSEITSFVKEGSFEELWRNAVFELYNVASSPKFFEIERKARQSSVTRDEYVTMYLNTEEFALQRTRAFYITSFLEWMPDGVMENTNPWMWGCNLFPREPGSIPWVQGDDRPRTYATYFNLTQAVSAYQNGNLAKAKEYLQEVLPNEAYIPSELRRQARLIYGQIRVLERDYSGAIKDATVVLDIYPESEHALHLRGNALALQGKFGQALVDYNHALRIKPDYPEVLGLRAIVYANLKDDKAALADLDRAISLRPQDATMRSQRAELLLNSSDPAIRDTADAIKEAKKACELSQWKSPYSLSVLASAYAALNDFDNAIKWQEKAVSLSVGPEKEGYAKALVEYKQRQKERK